MNCYNILETEIIKVKIFNTLILSSWNIGDLVKEDNFFEERIPINCKVGWFISEDVIHFSIFKLKCFNFDNWLSWNDIWIFSLNCCFDLDEIRIFAGIFDIDIFESISCIDDAWCILNILQYIVDWFVIFEYFSKAIHNVFLFRCFTIDLHFNLINFITIVSVRYEQINFDFRYCFADGLLSCSNDNSLTNSRILSSNGFDYIFNCLFGLGQINFCFDRIKRFILNDLSSLNHSSDSRIHRFVASCILLFDLFNDCFNGRLNFFINLFILNKVISCIILYDSGVNRISLSLLNYMSSDSSR